MAAVVVLALVLAACGSAQTVPPTTQNGIRPTTHPATTTTATAITTSTTLATQTEAVHPASWLGVTGAEGRFWLLGDYPCSTGTCLAIFRSDNGGTSFVRVGAPPVQQEVGITPSGLSIGSLLFVNKEDGYSYSRGGPTGESGLYRTDDGGMTWQHVHLAGALASSIVVTGERAYAVIYRCRSVSCTSYSLVTSPVARNSWTTRAKIPSAETNGENVSLAAFGSKVWVVLTSQGGDNSDRLLVSRDGGATFSESFRSDFLGAISCFLAATSTETLWGTCYSIHSSYNVRSTDGGKRFIQIAGANIDFGSTTLFPLSNRVGVLLFYNPEVPVKVLWELEVTSDAGRSFQPRLGHRLVLAIGFASRTTWLALSGPVKGQSGVAWRTANGGRSWQTVKLPSL